MDVWLAVVIGITQFVLGGMGVYVSLRPPKPEHHWYWLGGFVVVGFIGIGLTGWLTKVGSDEQRRSASIQEQLSKDVKDTKNDLQASRLEQARMSGHLEGIQTIMDNFSKSGIPGMKEFAQSVGSLATQSSKAPQMPLDIQCQHLADCPSTELSKRANELAANLKSIIDDYNQEYNQIVRQSNSVPLTSPDYAQIQKNVMLSLNGQRMRTIGKYHERYQSDVTAMRIVLRDRLNEHDASMDFDYKSAASSEGDVREPENIANDLRTMAGEVLTTRQHE